MNERAKAILNFWFKETTTKEHFKRSDDFDKKIRDLFENDYKKTINNKLEDWQDEPNSCLALIILLDQFSRNLFRNNPLAFAHDPKARLIVNKAIDRGDLKKIKMDYKFYFILPLIHSEDISDHIVAHNLCDSYLKLSPQYEEIKKQFNYHSFAIKKFGRYPHRNIILNRKNTVAEERFLKQPNSSW